MSATKKVDDLVTRSEDAGLLHPRVGRVHDTFANDACHVRWGDGRQTIEDPDALATYRIG